jgi:hypothetical protein
MALLIGRVTFLQGGGKRLEPEDQQLQGMVSLTKDRAGAHQYLTISSDATRFPIRLAICRHLLLNCRHC